MTDKFVAILMGSDSDLPVMQSAYDILKKLDIPVEMKISSAHRTPQATHTYVKDAESRGCQAFICAAGMAAHLAGTVAGLTTRPVIGVPLESGPLKGNDALYSTVQMPGGIPVATVAIGKAGAQNAAYLSAQILALSDDAVAERVKAERQSRSDAVIEKDKQLQAQLQG